MTRVMAIMGMMLLIPCARAGVRPLTLEDLCEGAVRVVRGEVTSHTVRWIDGRIVTDWRVSPSENLKGSGKEPFSVQVPGGTIGEVTMHAGEAPRLADGEEVILFLRPGVSFCDVYGWFQGKYSVVDGKIRELPGTSVDEFLGQVRRHIDEDK